MSLNPSRNVFITCAVTGSGSTTDRSSKVPVSPEAIANSCIEAANAGAAIVHIHVRDPKTAEPSRDAALYRAVVENIRDSGVDMVLNLTAGMGGDLTLGSTEKPLPPLTSGTDMVGATERLIHVKELLPEICTLDCGTMNFGEGDYIMTNSPAMLKDMAAQIQSLGVRPEIEAFIADRLLEAVWRESLWLVKDGIATTQDIDDAIRFGFGLRWAQMGTFETYRIAGGEAGMRHFMAQFGPCLSWPWTKLMDVPEFNDELVDLVSTQSDEQSGAYSIRELERIRDDNLIGIMQSLKANNWGAGQTLADYEKKLYDAELLSIDKGGDFSQQVRCFETTVPGDWADYNGHMTESRYLQCATHATDNFMAMIGADQAYINSGKSFFTVETHIRHLDEVAVLQNIFVDTQVLKAEGKKMHLYHRIQHDDGRLLATAEQMLIHVDLETRKASVPDVEVGTKLSKIAEQHAQLPYPEAAGKAIG